MILTGPAIRGAVERGEISIDPFDLARLNPASYDLELGPEVAMYTPEEQGVDRSAPTNGTTLRPCKQLDSKVKNRLTVLQMATSGFTIYPGFLYLMHTLERVCTRKYVPVLDGKSSIGRLGVLVHVTAGYGDPGFDGQYTLEVATLAHPVVLYPGMRIAQMRFHTVSGEVATYQRFGHYTGAHAVGPVRSASWRQFPPKVKTEE